jgi:hypothetical protein
VQLLERLVRADRDGADDRLVEWLEERWGLGEHGLNGEHAHEPMLRQAQIEGTAVRKRRGSLDTHSDATRG